MWSAKERITGLFILLLYVLASTSAGFAARCETFEETVDLSAYTLPDGTVPIICAQSGADASHKSGCKTPFLCRMGCLTAAPALSIPPFSILPLLVASKDIFWGPYGVLPNAPPTITTLGARGPPIA